MDRDLMSRLAHADHPVAAPLGDAAVDRLLKHVLVSGQENVLDLGCGGGEWLLRALVAHPGVRATGVDVSEAALAHANRRARELGVDERLTLNCADVTEFAGSERFKVVLNVAATHAFGGLLPTLDMVRGYLAPEGLALVGEGFWASAPSPEAIEMLGDLTDLAGTVEQVVAKGWVPVYGHISSREELDEYEWAWTGSLAAWALDHSAESHSGEAFAAAARHRSEWLHGYRDSFGFVCLVLRGVGD